MIDQSVEIGESGSFEKILLQQIPKHSNMFPIWYEFLMIIQARSVETRQSWIQTNTVLLVKSWGSLFIHLKKKSGGCGKQLSVQVPLCFN